MSLCEISWEFLVECPVCMQNKVNVFFFSFYAKTREVIWTGREVEYNKPSPKASPGFYMEEKMQLLTNMVSRISKICVCTLIFVCVSVSICASNVLWDISVLLLAGTGPSLSSVGYSRLAGSQALIGLLLPVIGALGLQAPLVSQI